MVRWLETLGRSISDEVTEYGDGIGVWDGVGVAQLWKYSQSSASARMV